MIPPAVLRRSPGLSFSRPADGRRCGQTTQRLPWLLRIHGSAPRALLTIAMAKPSGFSNCRIGSSRDWFVLLTLVGNGGFGRRFFWSGPPLWVKGGWVVLGVWKPGTEVGAPKGGVV